MSCIPWLGAAVKSEPSTKVKDRGRPDFAAVDVFEAKAQRGFVAAAIQTDRWEPIECAAMSAFGPKRT